MDDIDKALHQILTNAILHAQQHHKLDLATAAKAAARAFREGLAEFAAAPVICASTSPMVAEPQIGDVFEGGIYAGMTEVDGKPARLIQLPGEANDVNWDAAIDWAKLQGGDLPTPAEQTTLIANLKSEFKPRYYWSNKQHADGPSYAYVQDFVNGNQYWYHKSYTGSARAIRRSVI